MPSFNFNRTVSLAQKKNLIFFFMGLICVVMMIVFLLSGHPASKNKTAHQGSELVGVIDENFTEANTQSALTSQQVELESLKAQIKLLKETVEHHRKDSLEENLQLKNQLKDESKKIDFIKDHHNSNPQDLVRSGGQKPWQDSFRATESLPTPDQPRLIKPRLSIHSVGFSYRKKKKNSSILNSLNYVPSGTFVKAIILGGADADASVNGQAKNNGVMLFKLVAPGTLPNGKRSHLEGCFVTGSSYGDISSERAYVILDKLSCAQAGKPMIDRNVTGWAFFGGKVGIKGLPLMRDNKIIQWAGMSGALAGVASAAQYSRSVQSISPLGSATTVPTGNIAPYAGYGGASKAAEVLSDYYVKRAEQYHPVIQVGAGNFVTIVFKDGFYLEPDEKVLQQKANSKHKKRDSQLALAAEDGRENLDFTVPAEVLNHVNRASGDPQ